jgi:serine protease Do
LREPGRRVSVHFLAAPVGEPVRGIAVFGAVLFGVAANVLAQRAARDADAVFRVAERSVVSVHVFDPAALPRRSRNAFGSGVVIAPERVVTNCHVLAAGLGHDAQPTDLVVEVKAADQRSGRPGRLSAADPARDLCILAVLGLDASVAALGSTRTLRVGQPVYAVGSPQGLELTLSGGLISSPRKTGDAPIIQTDAALSPGSSGGGLFDAAGQLVGITSFGVQGGQNLNFALPVEWIKEAGAR